MKYLIPGRGEVCLMLRSQSLKVWRKSMTTSNKQIDYITARSDEAFHGKNHMLQQPIELGTLPTRHKRPEQPQATEVGSPDRRGVNRIIIGASSAMKHLFQIIKRVAPTNATVLISGRTGTGKELVAQEIHFRSLRNRKTFVDINCAALPDHLVESELFGHQKGAFTGAIETRKGLFEVADGGTLFLDEVQALKFELQAKLLRALQEKVIRRVGGRENIEIDVR